MTGEAKAISDIDKLAEVFEAKKVMVLNKTFFFNHHLAHPRMINIFVEILKIEHNNNLNAVFISETGPTDKYGEYFPDPKAMVISLPFLLKDTLKAIETNNESFGIAPAIWVNMIHTFCHELHHNIAYATDWDATAADLQVEEDEAHNYGLYMVEKIQKTMDAEPPALGQMPWFGARIMQHMIEKIQAEDVGWIKQKDMADTGVIYNDGNRQFTSLKEYYETTSEDVQIENEGAKLELKHAGEAVDAFDKATLAAEAEVCCHECSKAGMADMPIQHLPPTCPSTEKDTEMTFEKADNTLSPEELADLDMQEQLSGRAETEENTNLFINEQRTGSLDAGYEHIAKDQADSNFKGIPGTSGTTSANIDPTEYSKHLLKGGNAGNFKPEPKNITEAARAVWMDLYRHMFSVCGKTGGGVFANPKAIISTAEVNNDPITKGILVKSYTINERGQPVWMPCINGVYGRTFVNGTLPGYDVKLNCGGQEVNIRLIAQNSTKTSTYAQRARQGDCIAWIINQISNEWVGLIDNGVYHTKGPDGRWVAAR